MLLTIHWSPTYYQTFAYDQALSAAEIIADLVALLRAEGYAWPAESERCAFFRAVPDGHRPLAPSETLATAGLVPGATLYLAELGAPWMGRSATAGDPVCRLTLDSSCQIVLGAARTDLCRSFLIAQLSAAGVAFDPQDMRLRRVSRARHCDLLRDGGAWLLLPTSTTYLNGRRLPIGQAHPLPAGCSELMLGSEGWQMIAERSSS